MSNRTLVVDNDFFFVEFLTELLQNRGHEVVKAYDGKEGISRLEEGSFDLIFVDVVMPKIDGKQLIDFFRKRFPEANSPIIAMSATFIENRDNIAEIGADYYLAKGPIDTMAEEVNSLIDKAEKPSPITEDAEHLFEPGRLLPRQVTVELMEKLDFQRAIIESIGVGIMVIDRDARIIDFNSLALEILNRSLEDILNQHIGNIFPPGESRDLVNALKEIIQNQGLRKLVFKATLHTQEILVIVSVLRVGGKIAGWIIAMEGADQWAEQV